MAPKTPSRPPTTRSASSRLSRQASASAPSTNGHPSPEVEDKKPIIDVKPTNGVANHAHARPEFSDNVTFVTPKAGTTKKVAARPPTKPATKGKPKVRPSLLSVLLRLSMLSLAAYTLICPITPPSANQPITGPCTLLARAHSDIYDPFISPHVQSAWSSISSHPQVGPYAAHVENAFNYVTPYVHSARTAARSQLIPVVEKVQDLSSQAYSQAYTVAKPYIDPYAAQLSAAIDPYWSQAADLHRQHVIPHWLALRAQTQRVAHATSPYVLRARIASFQAYEKLKPHAHTAWLYTKSLAKQASDAVPIGGVFNLYVKPHWDTIVKQAGQLKDHADQKASPVLDQAQSTFAVASESVLSAAAAAHTGAASMASVAQSQAAGFAAAAQKSVYAAASVVHSVASEYVSVVQEKLSSITSAAQATGTSIASSVPSATHKVSDAIVDAASTILETATEYASHASAAASAAPAVAADAAANAASAVADSGTRLASQVSEAAATASASASEYVAPVAATISSSVVEYSSSASSSISQAAAAAASYASELQEEGLEGAAKLHFKAASLASSAYSKAAAAASTASDAAVSAHATAADLAAAAAVGAGEAISIASASLASVADHAQSQAVLVASLAQSSAAVASMSAVAKMDEAREALGIHEARPEEAAAEAANLLAKITPSDSAPETEDEEVQDEFEAWFASLLTDGNDPRDVGTETVLPPSPIEQAAPPAEIPADTSTPQKYVKPSPEELAEKRTGIEASHNKWDEMLHAIGQGAVERLQREIERVRIASGSKLLGENGGEWGKDLAEYEKEVGRVVAGVERYATKLHTEDRPAAEKTQLLEDVVAKVRNQVERWAGDVEDRLKTWWVGSEAGLMADVEKAEKDVMDIASEAQNELGPKYAWLEDVSAQDWKRYHRLVDDANEYSKTYRDLMYLSEDSPLYKALAELTGHVQDVLLGFEARLALIHPFADAPVSGADDNDPLVSPDIAEEKVQLPLFIPGAMAQPAAGDAYLQRSKEEVERALQEAQAAAGDILDEAHGTWHSATRAASKAAGATPTPETVQEYYDFAKAQAGEKAQAAYEQASGAVHDATRSVIRAAGGTPAAESLHEHVENVAAKAQDFYESASSVVESAYGAATSNVHENIHQATRAAARAAGGTPTPETAEEFYEYARGRAADAAQAAYDGANSVVHDATRSVIKAAGGTPSPESIHEHYDSLVDRAQSAVGSASSVAESVFGAATSNVYENIHKATRTVMKAAGGSPTPETAEEYYDFAKAQAQDAYKVVGDAVHDATRTIIKAAGGTPTPENFSEHASSLAGRASKGAASAYASVSSVASSLSDHVPSTDEVQARVEDILSSASAAIEEIAGDATNLAESVYDAGSSALHQATRTAIKAAGGTPTPEAFGEYVESLVDAASEGVHHATRSIISAAGGTPEPESLKEHYDSVVARASEAVVGAGAAAGDVVDSLYSSAHSATRSAYKAMGGTPTPETFEEHYDSVAARASDIVSDGYDKAAAAAAIAYDSVSSAGSSASDQAASLASQASDSAATAYDSASSAVHYGTRVVMEAVGATPSPENLAETVSSLTGRAADSALSVAAVIESLAADVANNLASATETVKSAAGVESAKPLSERAASSVHSVLDSLASSADDAFTHATDSLKSAAGVETAKPATERASSSVASIASSISSLIYHEEL